MLRPRAVLVVTTAVMALVAVQTFTYPPSYLALASLWGALAAIASVSCLAAAVHPRRMWVVTAGAALVVSALGRSLGILGQLGTGGVSHEQQASFLIAATTWANSAMLFYVTWVTYILPWGVATREGRRG